jgi:hypothetical protein
VVCSSGIGFDPVVEGQRLIFAFRGAYRGTAILVDRQTGSHWMHMTGECFQGTLAGMRLARLPTGRHTTWRDWRSGHKDTDVMLPDPRLTEPGARQHYRPEDRYGSGSAEIPPDFLPSMGDIDPRLPSSALLYGIVVDGAARAYPLEDLRATPVVEERVRDVPVTVWFDEESRSAGAFPREFEGRLLSFRAEGDGRFRETETGSIFDLDGRCVEGRMAGARLVPLFGLLSEWYGWSALHPATTIYGR